MGAQNSPARLEAAVNALKGRVKGRVYTDRVTKALYSTDASPCRIEPAAVLVAEVVDDIPAALEVCVEHDLPVTTRGAGTSLSGQCCGSGLNLDISRLDRIEWLDVESKTARMEPGATWHQLNLEANKLGLEYGPDPATKRQCTAGGMVGSNAGGTHSIVYGATVDHVVGIEAVMPSGEEMRLRESTDGTLQSAGVPSSIIEELERVRQQVAPELGPQFFSLARRGSGYQLEHFAVDKPHAGKLMAGSEGTLALMTAVELSLTDLPEARVLAVVGFTDMHAAIAAVPALVETGPCAVELVSKSMLELARRDPVHARAVADIDQELGALLFVEYQGVSFPEATSGFERMDKALSGCAGVRYNGRFADPDSWLRMWAVREAGVGALSTVASGPLLPQGFIEDTIVAVDKLPGFIKAFEELFEAHDMEAIWYGHASTGLVHVRPFVNLTSAEEIARLHMVMGETVDLVKAWEGDMAGEHGDGLVRSYWNRRLFGDEIYSALKAIKGAFDPTNILNPGKVVDGPQPLAALRYDPSYKPIELKVLMDYSDQGNFASAAERCFGAGVCRKRISGTMCPPAAATGLEEHSTRARANLLRSVVAGQLDLDDLSSDQAAEVMDTCVMCKACKTECPARVDMARMKIEWLDMMRRNQGATAMQRSIANLRTLQQLGAPFAPIANKIQSSSWMKRRMRIAPQRRMPAIDRKPLTKRIRVKRGDAYLYPDCFTTYQEPSIGMAAATLIRAGGRKLALARTGCCGRTMLSEGYIEKARRAAHRSAKALRRIDGQILFAEPSCMSAVTDDWKTLIGDVSDIAERCVLAEEWVADNAHALSFEPGGSAVLHGHCHQKALWGTGATEKALELVPDLDVEVLDSGCCGMAGGFGYQAERFDLSRAMGERVLLPAVRSADISTAVIATGTSCRHQIADLSGRRAEHPLEFLARRLQSTVD
ncbi:MAG TPA: FAD-linked oxidase C-terminal domain-containing protein [Actinomycetota bacterium]|nr:FAD-linked oxidase C-terminal domain-containing protein [Actinomycetota bacterium]